MAQSKKKKNIKKIIKQPILKNSINIKIDLEDNDKNEKKKKPKKKKRVKKDDTNYVDEAGQPVEIINKSFSGGYMPQPFSRNSTILGNSLNESTIMDKVIDKISRLNSTMNQSMNQSTNQSLNTSSFIQNTQPPAPPQLPSTGPQSLNLSSPTRQVGMTPLQTLNRIQQQPPSSPTMTPSTIVPASPSIVTQLNRNIGMQLQSPYGFRPLSQPFNPQEFLLSSVQAATISQDAVRKVFDGTSDIDQAEIKQAVLEVKNKHFEKINEGTTDGARSMKFKAFFKDSYSGPLNKKEASSIGWQYYKLLP